MTRRQTTEVELWDPHPDDGGPNGVRTRAFGAALRDALSGAGMRQEDLADVLGTKQNVISQYTTGANEPSYETVFAIEKAIPVKPGALSRYLGYLPLEAVKVSADVERAIADDPFLSPDARDHLRNAYRLVKGRRTAGQRGRPPKGS